MSMGVQYLHSHSGIERELRIPKNVVLVDESFKGLFEKTDVIVPIVYNKVKYYEVPIMSFINLGGVFKNLND